jgi:hypothetical protein
VELCREEVCVVSGAELRFDDHVATSFVARVDIQAQPATPPRAAQHVHTERLLADRHLEADQIQALEPQAGREHIEVASQGLKSAVSRGQKSRGSPITWQPGMGLMFDRIAVTAVG